MAVYDQLVPLLWVRGKANTAWQGACGREDACAGEEVEETGRTQDLSRPCPLRNLLLPARSHLSKMIPCYESTKKSIH